MPLMSNTDEWTSGPGVSGFPRWTYTQIGTYSPDVVFLLEQFSIIEAHLKLTLLPNEDELVAMPTNGQTLTLVSISPRNWGRQIDGCVKIGPVKIDYLAAPGSWATYSSNALARFTIQYQQTKLNHDV